MNDTFYNSKRNLVLTAILALIIPMTAVSTNAQTESATTEGTAPQSQDTAAADQSNRQIVLADQAVDNDVEITDSNVDIFVTGGVHTINGSVTINGAGDRVIIGSDPDEGLGSVQIAGTLVLGPDNAPTLGIDLTHINLNRGSRFVIVEASEIIGEFGGFSNGMITIGGYTFRIIYSPTSITMIVVNAPPRWVPIVTPITVMDSDLINPTSTGPSI